AIPAGGQYDLARYTGEDYAGNLSELIAGATNENPSARPTLDVFAQQLGDWLEGREVADSIVREAERMRRVRHDVLRHIVALVRREPFFVNWDVKSASDPSGIGD